MGPDGGGGRMATFGAPLSPDEGERGGWEQGRNAHGRRASEWRRGRELRLHFLGGLRGEKWTPALTPLIRRS